MPQPLPTTGFCQHPRLAGPRKRAAEHLSEETLRHQWAHVLADPACCVHRLGRMMYSDGLPFSAALLLSHERQVVEAALDRLRRVATALYALEAEMASGDAGLASFWRLLASPSGHRG
jgi:hypothetical protein